MSLFERSAAGDISALSCPCSRAQHALGNVTAQLSFGMDSFASDYGFPSENDQGVLVKYFTDMFSLDAVSEGLGTCVKDPARLQSDLVPVLQRLLDDSSGPAGYVPYMDSNRNSVYYSAADVAERICPASTVKAWSTAYGDLKTAICEFAFGVRPHVGDPMSIFGAPWLTDPAQAKTAACSGAVKLAPWRLYNVRGKEYFPHLQAGRSTAYKLAIGVAVSSLQLYFNQLRASSKLVQIMTQSAVSPVELQQLVRDAFERERSTVGARAAALLAAASSDPLSETAYGSAYAMQYAGVSAPITEGSSLFSSPLPFGRADFGPTTFFGLSKLESVGWLYLITGASIGTNDFLSQNVAAAGTAALRISPPKATRVASAYPMSQISETAAGISYLAGNDFITLLDACAAGDPMSVELYSLFPGRAQPLGMSMGNVGAGSLNFLSEGKCCSAFMEQVTNSFSGAHNSSAAPILTVPVACPASLVKLGRARQSWGGPPSSRT